jgi:hypothetical protein
MATTQKSKVMVELYDLTITERKDDRFGRVVTSKSLNENDRIIYEITVPVGTKANIHLPNDAPFQAEAGKYTFEHAIK